MATTSVKVGVVWSDLDHRLIQDGQGRLKLGENAASVMTSIDNILRTSQGERCLSGLTKIALLNGQDVMIQDLVGQKSFWVYTFNHTSGRIEPSLAKAFCTGHQKVLRLVLDNNQEIVCTPDHLIMLRNGHFCKAKDLRPGQSLMPLYIREDSDGYFSMYQPFVDIWERIHRMVMIWKNQSDTKGFCVHHKDFDKKNNFPENLLRVDLYKHIGYHSRRTKEHNQKLWSSSEYRDMMCSGEMQRRTAKDPSFGAAVQRGLREHLSNPENRKIWSERTSAVAKKTNARPDVQEIHHQQGKQLGEKFWSLPEFAEARKNNREAVVRAVKRKHQEDEDFREIVRTYGHNVGICSVVKKLQKHIPLVISKYGVFSEQTWEEYRTSLGKSACAYPHWKNLPSNVMLLNHKVVRVEYFDEVVPVYDLQVERNHNFALSSGVFVHNCMLPSFGGNLRGVLFENITQTMMKVLSRQVKDTIEAWDDRVAVQEVELRSDPDRSLVSITIAFSIRGHGNVFEYKSSLGSTT